MTPKIPITEKQIWANTGGANIKAPDQTKINSGYLAGEKPHHNHFNWIYNIIMQDLVHILQNGIAKWDATTEYQQGALTLHADPANPAQTSIYRALKVNTAAATEPSGATDANWQKNLETYADYAELKAGSKSVAIDPSVLLEGGLGFQEISGQKSIYIPHDKDLIIKAK